MLRIKVMVENRIGGVVVIRRLIFIFRYLWIYIEERFSVIYSNI